MSPLEKCDINLTLQLLTASLDGKVMIWDYLDGSFLRVIVYSVIIQTLIGCIYIL